MSTTQSPTTGVSDGNIITSRVFAEVFQAYLECSDEMQAAVRDMIEIVNDPRATSQEVDAALLTISEALFPSHYKGSLGFDLQEAEQSASSLARNTLEEMDQEEAAFAERVEALMQARGVTQSELASRVGIGQPAISMLLARKCRPQQGTVEKIAEALEVSAQDLWPEAAGE